MTDYKKLVKFANLMGVRVRKVRVAKDCDDAGVFVYQKSRPEIQIHFTEKTKEQEMTLTLLHEIGHAMDWVQLGRPHEDKMPAALWREEKGMKYRQRAIVHGFEARAVNNMEFIHSLLKLRLPEVTLKRERMFDLWVSEYFLRTGQYPVLKERKKKMKSLRMSIAKTTVS